MVWVLNGRDHSYSLTIQKPDHLKSGFQVFPDFKWPDFRSLLCTVAMAFKHNIPRPSNRLQGKFQVTTIWQRCTSCEAENAAENIPPFDQEGCQIVQYPSKQCRHKEECKTSLATVELYHRESTRCNPPRWH